MTRERIVAVVVASALSLAAAVGLSAGDAPGADGAGAGEVQTREALQPNQDSASSRTWILDDWSWM